LWSSFNSPACRRGPLVSAADQLEKINMTGCCFYGTDAEGGAPYVYPDPRIRSTRRFEYELADAIAAKLGVKAKLVQNQWDHSSRAGARELRHHPERAWKSAINTNSSGDVAAYYV